MGDKLNPENSAYPSIQKSTSRYTLYGSYLVDQRIKHDLKIITQDLLHRHPKEVIETICLGGTFGRGEGGLRKYQGLELPHGAYEIAVIYKALSKSQNTSYRKYLKQAQEKLSPKLKIGLYFYPPLAQSQIKDLPFQTHWYELAHGHKAIWGNPHTLRNFPPFPHHDLPRQEAFALLLKAGLSLLNDSASAPTKALLLNAQLALGDATLILSGKYHFRFENRIKNLKKLALSHATLPSAQQLGYLYQEALQNLLYEQEENPSEKAITPSELKQFKDFFCDIYLGLLGFYFQLNNHNWSQHQSLLTRKNQTAGGLSTLIKNFKSFKRHALHPQWLWVALDFRRLYLLPFFLKGTLPPSQELKYLLPKAQNDQDLAFHQQVFLDFCQ